jgi:signal transduction histidine kinase
MLPAVLAPGAHGGRRTTRDWLVDLACFALAVASGALLFAQTTGDGDPPPEMLQVVDLAYGAVGCVALWARRRWPVGVAVLLLPATFFSAAAVGAGVMALFTVAVHRRWPVAAAVAAVQLAGVPVYYAVHPDAAYPLWVFYLLAAASTLAVVAWGMFVRARRELVLSLRDRADRAEAEQKLRVEQARDHERARIAREMHDVLAHRISLVSLHAGALAFRPDAPPDEVARAAEVIRGSAHLALQDLREVIGVLRGAPEGRDPERPQPALADVPELVRECRRAGMHVALELTCDPVAAPEGAGRTAFRVVQEGLTNARKHARGAAVRVTLSGGPGEGLAVEVRNALAVGGPAAADIPGAGAGLAGLAERVALAGERLEHGPTADGAFRLAATLPWPP